MPQRPRFHRSGSEIHDDIESPVAERAEELVNMSRDAVPGTASNSNTPQNSDSAASTTTQTRGRMFFFKGRAAPRSPARPPSYRSRLPNEDDIEARAADNEQDAAGQPDTTPPAGIQAPNELPDRHTHPHLNMIYSIQGLFGLLELLTFSAAVYCIAVGYDENSDKTAWTHDQNYIPLLVFMLTFGAYWGAMLLKVCMQFSGTKNKTEAEKMSELGLTYKEWKAIVDILFPILLACAAATVYPLLQWLKDDK